MLGVLRSLKKKGVAIYAADVNKAPAFYSKYVCKSFIISDMLISGEDKLINELIEIGKNENEKLCLFTGSDDYLLTFSRRWSELSPYYKSTFETDFEKLEYVLSKSSIYKIAREAKIDYPKTYYSPVIDSGQIQLPVIIKPAIKKSNTIDVVKHSFRIRYCDTQKALKEAIAILQKIESEYVVQQYIPGGDDTLFTVGAFVIKGEMIAALCGRKIRQFPPDLGECSYGELLKDSLLLDSARKVLRKSEITGICQIEYKKYAKKYYLMEINPRPWSWISLFTYGGLNLPYIACQMKVNENFNDMNFNFKDGKWMYILQDLKYNVWKNRNVSLFKWIKQLVSSNKYAFWDWKDPKPFFVDLYYFIKA